MSLSRDDADLQSHAARSLQRRRPTRLILVLFVVRASLQLARLCLFACGRGWSRSRADSGIETGIISTSTASTGTRQDTSCISRRARIQFNVRIIREARERYKGEYKRDAELYACPFGGIQISCKAHHTRAIRVRTINWNARES